MQMQDQSCGEPQKRPRTSPGSRSRPRDPAPSCGQPVRADRVIRPRGATRALGTPGSPRGDVDPVARRSPCAPQLRGERRAVGFFRSLGRVRGSSLDAPERAAILRAGARATTAPGHARGESPSPRRCVALWAQPVMHVLGVAHMSVPRRHAGLTCGRGFWLEPLGVRLHRTGRMPRSRREALQVRQLPLAAPVEASRVCWKGGRTDDRQRCTGAAARDERRRHRR
jgi:hypothetical protein